MGRESRKWPSSSSRDPRPRYTGANSWSESTRFDSLSSATSRCTIVAAMSSLRPACPLAREWDGRSIAPTKCRYSLQPDPKSGRLGRCVLTTSKRCPRSAVVACSHRPRSTADASCRMAAVAPCRTKLTTKRCIDTCESRVASASRCSAASGPRWRSTTAVPSAWLVARRASRPALRSRSVPSRISSVGPSKRHRARKHKAPSRLADEREQYRSQLRGCAAARLHKVCKAAPRATCPSYVRLAPEAVCVAISLRTSPSSESASPQSRISA
mmetsp:Transcript_16422/g.40662  ORF Transcript_16422/g.40662 Transcript_16422/m.40662 type:complete len:270 (-) Transcript_16422:1405-2214(-)